jgi:hypothetical protein
MKVRLTRKYAERIDGIDLRNQQVGDVIDMPEPQARLLLLEQWALPERREEQRPDPPRRRSTD